MCIRTFLSVWVRLRDWSYKAAKLQFKIRYAGTDSERVANEAHESTTMYIKKIRNLSGHIVCGICIYSSKLNHKIIGEKDYTNDHFCYNNVCLNNRFPSVLSLPNVHVMVDR